MINANVALGDGCFVDSHALLGASTSDYYDDPDAYEPATCRIGKGAVIRSHSVIYAGVTIGDDFSCGHHVTIREGSRIGDGVQVGTLSDLQPEVTIGDYARDGFTFGESQVLRLGLALLSSLLLVGAVLPPAVIARTPVSPASFARYRQPLALAAIGLLVSVAVFTLLDALA